MSFCLFSRVSESSVHLKEEDDDLVATHQMDRPKSLRVKGKGNKLISGFEHFALKTSKLGKVSALDVSAIPEAKEDPQQSTAKISRKKQKTLASKVRENVDYTSLV